MKNITILIRGVYYAAVIVVTGLLLSLFTSWMNVADTLSFIAGIFGSVITLLCLAIVVRMEYVKLKKLEEDLE